MSSRRASHRSGRLMAFTGIAGALYSFLAGFGYFVYKLVFWNRYSLGIAPLVIGIFFLDSIQLFFLGVLGEYIGAIHTQVQKDGWRSKRGV